MRRFDHKEGLQNREHGGGSPVEGTQKEIRLTREETARIAQDRRGSLAALRSEITSELYEALVAKLRYEETLLAEAADRDERASDRRRRRMADLPAEHFLKKSLDPNLI